MNMLDCHPMDEIFSHEDATGVTRHFNSTALIRWLVSRENPPVAHRLDLDADLVAHIERNHGVEQGHLKNVTDLETPILLVVFEDSTNLVVDGNHRIVKRWREGHKTVLACILHPGEWEHCLVTDLELPREMYTKGTQVEHNVKA